MREEVTGHFVTQEEIDEKGFGMSDENSKFKVGQWVGDEKEWVLDTEGTAMLEVASIDEVDFTRTKSNHIIDMFTYVFFLCKICGKNRP